MAAAGLAATATARADAAFPSRPIRVLVPQGAGGFDVYARLIGPRLQATLGQPIVIDNRPGANGNIALGEVGRAAPDGHTLLLAPTGTLTANVSLYRNMPLEPVDDLAPVVLATTTPMVWLTHPGSEIDTLADLVRIARARPGQLNYTFPGVGTLNHLLAEAFKQRHGIEIEGISVSSPTVSMTELVAGRVPVAVEALGSCADYVMSGRLRALAVTTRARAPQLPAVPTVMELGLEEREYLGWYAFVAPRGTPAPVIAKLNAAINEALTQPDVTVKLAGLGAAAHGGTPEALHDFMVSERATWREVIRRAGIQQT
nr:tripartite tricarboxylate transporter substrate binding protein [Roseomonas acroporae]